MRGWVGVDVVRWLFENWPIKRDLLGFSLPLFPPLFFSLFCFFLHMNIYLNVYDKYIYFK